MNHYFIASILTIAITVILAGFTLTYGRKYPTSRWYGIYTLMIGLWSFGWLMMVSHENSAVSICWARLLLLPASFIPVTFLTTVQYINGTHQNVPQRIARYLLLGFGFFFAVASFHPKFIPTCKPIVGFTNYSIVGPVYKLFHAWLFISVIIILNQLIADYRSKPKTEQHKIIYVFACYVVGYIGGFSVFLPGYGIPMPKYSLYTIPLAHIFLFHAIINYRLLDFRVALRRATLLFSIYFFLVFTVTPTILILNNHFHWIPSNSRGIFVGLLLFISIIFSIGPFLYAYLVRKNSYFQEHAAAGLTHELKSPLAAIQGALATIKDLNLSATTDPKLADYLSIIDRNSTRLNSFVNDLLQVFRIQNKTRPMTEEKVDLKLLSDRVIDFYRPLATFKGTSLSSNYPDTSIILSCDSQKIETVVSNLISNAVKFTLNGIIALSIETSSVDIKISVVDSGSGIPKADLAHIFEPFYQGRGGKELKGAGIGLTIAKAWVEAHGGKIWAESEGEGKGTTVSFTLPVN